MAGAHRQVARRSALSLGTSLSPSPASRHLQLSTVLC